MRSKPAAIRRILSFGGQPIKFPSHYAFLLITPEMASSSFLKPARHVRGLIHDDRLRYRLLRKGLSAPVSVAGGLALSVGGMMQILG
jgi:hypothetical protein